MTCSIAGPTPSSNKQACNITVFKKHPPKTRRYPVSVVGCGGIALIGWLYAETRSWLGHSRSQLGSSGPWLPIQATDADMHHPSGHGNIQGHKDDGSTYTISYGNFHMKLCMLVHCLYGLHGFFAPPIAMAMAIRCGDEIRNFMSQTSDSESLRFLEVFLRVWTLE